MKEVVIQSNDAGQRLDRFLAKAFPNLKKSAMYKAIREKKIKVNRKRADFRQILQEGDHLLLFLRPEFLETAEKEITQLPDPEIVFENDELIVMNKPAGLLSMKDQAGFQDTLNGRLQSYLQKSGQYDPRTEQSFTPAIAHRLDRNTSGLVAAAKTAEAARKLARSIQDHSMKKSYLAITDGKPRQGRIELYLKKEQTIARISDTPAPDYDPAIMHVKTIARAGGRFLSRIDLETGRFHQIRASLAHLGTPLSEDRKYNGGHGSGQYQLQAYRIDLGSTPFSGTGVIELPASKQLSLSAQSLKEKKIDETV